LEARDSSVFQAHLDHAALEWGNKGEYPFMEIEPVLENRRYKPGDQRRYVGSVVNRLARQRARSELRLSVRLTRCRCSRWRRIRVARSLHNAAVRKRGDGQGGYQNTRRGKTSKLFHCVYPFLSEEIAELEFQRPLQ
jgi:hypothetical protein